MNPNDIQDAKVGTRQVTAIYLGENLVWPTSHAVTYEITGAIIHYSSGNIIDAGAAESTYSGNYVYVTGTVVVYTDGVATGTITDAMLTPALTNTSDFVVLNAHNIYGYNLGSTATSAIKSTNVDVTYRNSPSFRVGSAVEQERNYDTVTSSTVRIEESPVIAPDEVPNTRYVDLNIYESFPNHICPAYGGTATLYFYGGHDEANYSTTAWNDWTTYTHTYTSGAVVVDPAVITASGQIGPTMVGQPWGVTDEIATPTLPSWLTFANGVLTIASEGVTPYQNGRSAELTAYNGSASDSVTVYQQYNRVEDVNYTYNLSVAFDVSGTIPSSGGIFSVDYVSKRTQYDTYTSGEPDAHLETDITATVSGSNCIPDTDFVTGTGSFTVEVEPNMSTILTRDIGVTITEFGESASDSVEQDAYVAPSTNTAAISPTVDFRTGKVILRLVMTSGTFPGEVVIGGLVYHYIPTGSYERTIPILDEVTIDDPRIGVTLNEIPAFSSGASGEHWFSATSVSEIGLGNTTFPHTEYEVIDLT